MKIGGLQKFTLLDYPGEVAAIIFTQGCNFRCGFCYNPMLVEPAGADKLKYPLSGGEQKGHQLLEEGDLFAFLEKRFGKLSGVVITGGEPTIQPDLPDFLKKIKQIGYRIKLDTNGTNPVMLETLLPAGLVDYIAMDIKTSPEKYDKLAGKKVNLENIRKSAKIIISSGLPHEFRTTVVSGWVDKEDMVKIGQMIQGADNWYLQAFKPDAELVDDAFRKIEATGLRTIKEMARVGANFVGKCEVR